MVNKITDQLRRELEASLSPKAIASESNSSAIEGKLALNIVNKLLDIKNRVLEPKDTLTDKDLSNTIKTTLEEMIPRQEFKSSQEFQDKVMAPVLFQLFKIFPADTRTLSKIDKTILEKTTDYLTAISNTLKVKERANGEDLSNAKLNFKEVGYHYSSESITGPDGKTQKTENSGSYIKTPNGITKTGDEIPKELENFDKKFTEIHEQMNKIFENAFSMFN